MVLLEFVASINFNWFFLYSIRGSLLCEFRSQVKAAEAVRYISNAFGVFFKLVDV